MNRLAEFFQEANGQLSSMRLYCFIALLVAMTLSFNGATFDLIIIWIVAAFAPKAVQKVAENAQNKAPKS